MTVSKKGLRANNGAVAAPPYTRGPYTWSEDVEFEGDIEIGGDLTVTGTFSFGAVTATSLVNTGTTQLGDNAADTVTIYGNTTTNAAQNPTFNWQGTGNFTTSTGTVTLAGDVAISSGKDLTMAGDSTFGTGTGNVSLNGDVTIADGKDLALTGAGTFTSGTGDLSILGDMTMGTTKKVEFHDSGQFIHAPAYAQLLIQTDGTLDLTATTDVTLTSADIVLDGDVDIDGTHTFTTGTGKATFGGDVDVTGNLDVTGSGTFGTLTFTDASITGNLDIVGQNLQATTGTLDISKTGSMTTVKGTANFDEAVTMDSTLEVDGASQFDGAVTLGNAKADTITVTGDIAASAVENPDIDFSGSSGTFSTTTGAVSLAGNTTISGAGTFTTGTGLTTISGDLTLSGHKGSQTFLANAFQYPAPGTDWTPAITGATIVHNRTDKKVWIPLNFLKIGDEIQSYKLTGDCILAGGTLALDCKLVTVNLEDPLTTSDIADGAILQITTDGDFDAACGAMAVTTVATDKMYLLEINGTTSDDAGNILNVMGAEVLCNRK